MRNKVIGIIVQARYNSLRLPGKVLLEFGGKKALEIILERAKAVKGVDKVVLATTTNPEDDPLVSIARALDCVIYRGDENDVLRRITEAARLNQIDVIIRLCADEPFFISSIAERLIEEYQKDDYQYISTNLEKSFPVGVDAELIDYSLLKLLQDMSLTDYDKEHVSTYILRNRDSFKTKNIYAEEKEYNPEIKLTLDTEVDYQRLMPLYAELMDKHQKITPELIVREVENNPHLQRLFLNQPRKVIFCCNANFDAGIGDVKTCLSLAKDLNSRKGMEVKFLMEDYETGLGLVEGSSFSALAIDRGLSYQEKTQRLLQILKQELPDFVVFEACPNDLKLIEQVHRNGYRILCIDFGEKERIYAEVIVNWDWKAHPDNYLKTDSIKNQLFLMGPEYVILEDEYRRPVERVIRDEPERILITTGGTDFSNLSVKLLGFLEEFEVCLNIDLIIGGGVADKDAIRRGVSNSRHRITCHKAVPSLYPFLVGADIVISSAGLSSYEIVATAAPGLMIIAKEHQHPKPEFLSKRNAAINLGDYLGLDKEDFLKKFKELYYDYELRKSISDNCKGLLDCRGTERISDCLERLIHGCPN